MWTTALLALGAASSIPTIPIAGPNGAAVDLPMAGLGTWQYNESVAEQAVTDALALGYTHIDCAYGYDNQAGVGKALAASPRARASYFITTKIPGGLNESEATANFNDGLDQLGIGYVDLLLVHYPASWAGAGGRAARQAEWRVMEGFVKAGRARALGVSHYCRRHVQDILDLPNEVPIAVNQVQYHVGMGAAGVTDGDNATDDKGWMEAQGILYQGFSPLCGPCGTTELIDGELVVGIGKKYGKSGAQVSLKWQVMQGIPVIPKAHVVAYLKENIDLFDWELSDVDVAKLNAATSPAVAGNAGPPATSGDCDVA